MLVTGILLFNKVSKKEEVEVHINDLKVLPVTTKSIENELHVTQSLAWKYTALLEELTDPDVQHKQCDMPIVLLKQALYNVRQHEVFLKMLLADADLCTKHIEMLQTELSSKMKLLKETMQSKTAVPTATVFPVFKVLSKLWSGLQDEAELLNILSNITLSLQPFLASQAKIFSEPYLDGLLEGSEVKTDEQRMTESSGTADEWLLPETTTSFNELPQQYNGFCGYTFVNRDGLLLPGTPQDFVFPFEMQKSSKQAALNFACSPDDFVEKVAEKAKCSPELIQLLKLPQQFSCVSPYSEDLKHHFESLLVTKCESGTQTDIHPMETNIVKSYEWNEWELRRKALKLADLRTKVTHSTQTDLSHLRRENVTQTWLPKDAACQSKRDGESNVPKPQIYLAGLRGQRNAQVAKINLTRSVDE
uniref:Cilia- and flagella-associated protein 206 n=1 Tax=Acanthochromis polyacanthus TaxID=80966 RepID=A0A3Q1FE53_9TELE